MKFWCNFSYTHLYDDENLMCGITAYKHKRKEWKGFTIAFHFLQWVLIFHYVNNYIAYKAIINKRWTRKPK